MPAVLDADNSYAIGTIGLVPMIIALIAQAVPGELGADLLTYSNVSAAAIISILFIWLLTKHIPAREARAENRQDMRDAKVDERIERAQVAFTAALREQLDASKSTAASGHAALQSVMEKYQMLSHALEKNSDAIRDLTTKIERHA